MLIKPNMKNQNTLHSLLLLSILFLFSCRKEFSLEDALPIKNPAGLSIPAIDEATVKSNVMLQVLDADKKPISFANVSCGIHTAMTDKSGFVMFEDVDISAHNGAVSVKKEGYFSCTRTFITETGSWNYLRIILNEKKLTASIQSDKGGVITLTSGASLTLPPNGMVLKGTSQRYNGTVQVYADWLDPASPNLMNEMQGELRGINLNGEEKAMKTYGMLNVELKGENGEELQLGSTQLSTVTFPVSQDLLSTAEAAIPLWHFSDSTHRWVEEGSATKNGNVYVGKVNHFSCWNLDYAKPYKLVRCKFKIVTPKHRGCLNREILVHEKGDSWGGHGLSDQDGYLDCLVPEGTELYLDILGCAIKQFKIGPYTEDNNIDSIVLNVNDGFEIKGNVVNCSGVPLAHGYVELNMDGAIRVPTSNGSFEVNYAPQICTAIDSIFMYSVDLDTKNISTIHSIPASLGMDTTLSIKACDDLASLANGLVSGLVAYYPFNGNAQDESGNGLNGVTNNVTLISDRFGLLNSAYDFNGVSSFIQVNHDPTLNSLPLTVSCWFKFNASQIAGEPALISKYTAATWNGWNMTLDSSLGGNIHPWYIKDAANEILGNYGNAPFMVTNIGDDVWHHIVFVVDAVTGGRIYLNGNPGASFPWVGTASQPVNTWPMYFGFYPSAAYYKGAIDDIRIYNRVLSQNEILYLATH